MFRSKAAAIGRAGLRGARRHWVLITVPIVLLVIAAYVLAFMLDEPLRRITQGKMNHALKGYTANIKRLDFHPFGFSLDLRHVTITQDEHPDPPVLLVERLSASVHWRALLSGRLVADVEIIRPVVRVDLPQARKEISDPVPVKERGWQEALEAVYPLKINHFEIRHGDVTYVDKGPFKPLHLSELNLVATNIRNVRSQERTYPSDVYFSARVFDTGRVGAEGQADFMAEPTPTFRGGVDLTALDDALNSLARLDPQQSSIVELRFFGGLSIEETAAELCISPATVKRLWSTARVWLYREMSGAART